MGWTTTDRRGDAMTDREFIEFYELRGVEILDHARAGSTHFFVYKSPTTGQNSVIVALTEKRGHEFSVKILDESVGPADDRCPRRILDRLGTPPNEWAAQWRQRCHDRRARAGRAVLRPGNVIRFAAPIKFTHGHEFQTFQFVERSTFKADGASTLVTITRWRERTDWTLVETDRTAERQPEWPAEPSVVGPASDPQD